MKTFNNPLSNNVAPDPFITFDTITGYYYCLFTLGNRIELFRSKTISTIVTARDSKVVYRANEEDKNSAPVMGVPVGIGIELSPPSGEVE